MKLKLTLLALLAMTSAASAQTFTTTVTAPNVTASGVIRGGTNTTPNNTSLAADFKGAVGITGVLTTSGNVSIVGGHKLTATGSTELGAPGNSTTLVVNGKSTTINTVSTDINSTTTNTRSINATGNVAASGVVTGKLGLSAGNGGFTVSNTGDVTANNLTADNIATTGGKVNINGSNGNILTQGVFNANGKAFVDGTNGSITATGVTNANGGLKVSGGAQVSGGLDVQNAQIKNVATGTADRDAVNVGQLKNGLAEEAAAREAGDTANAAAIAAEATRATDAEAALDARIDANANASTAQIAASEARSVKASHQSSALAMAVAGMTGASPTDHGRTAITMGVGTFGGETAIAVGVSHAVTDAVRVFGSITKVSGGDTGAAIGGSYSF